MVTNACSGVSVRCRRVQAVSRVGASKASISGGIAIRFQYV